MTDSLYSGVAVYVCHQCIPEGQHLPRQWTQDGVHVQVTELPCSGKTDAAYLFHALEAGGRGLLVVTCPQGECRLSQGNYRAEVRIRTMQRLLAEIGMEPERAALVHCAPGDDVQGLVNDAVQRLCALGDSPVAANSM
jgi:coenzyme F420-reducing hydrogenase delta subunit